MVFAKSYYNIVGSSNGRTTGFDPVNLGSSPSPTAKLSAMRDALKSQKLYD